MRSVMDTHQEVFGLAAKLAKEAGVVFPVDRVTFREWYQKAADQIAFDRESQSTGL